MCLVFSVVCHSSRAAFAFFFLSQYSATIDCEVLNGRRWAKLPRTDRLRPAAEPLRDRPQWNVRGSARCLFVHCRPLFLQSVGAFLFFSFLCFYIAQTLKKTFLPRYNLRRKWPHLLTIKTTSYRLNAEKEVILKLPGA